MSVKMSLLGYWCMLLLMGRMDVGASAAEENNPPSGQETIQRFIDQSS